MTRDFSQDSEDLNPYSSPTSSDDKHRAGPRKTRWRIIPVALAAIVCSLSLVVHIGMIVGFAINIDWPYHFEHEPFTTIEILVLVGFTVLTTGCVIGDALGIAAARSWRQGKWKRGKIQITSYITMMAIWIGYMFLAELLFYFV